MKEKKVKKKSGGYRYVLAVTAAERRILRRLLPQLQQLAEQADRHDVAHGFRYNRNWVTNAKKHVGYAWSVCCDIQDFFDSVTAEKVPDLAKQFPQAFYNGVARQGLPTSPVVANIAAAPMDAYIVENLPQGCVYSRYADDMTVSGNDYAVIPAVLSLLQRATEQAGFRLAKHKTHVQDSRFGRRIITGVSVGATDVRPTRDLRRRLRAAMHAAPDSPHAAGLREAALLREPTGLSRSFRNKVRRIQQRARELDLDPFDIIERIHRAKD